MAILTSQLLVRLVDGVSGPARAAAAALRGIGTASRAAAPGGGIVAAQAQIRSAIEANNASLAAMRGRMVEAVAGGFALQRALAAVIQPAVAFESAMADIAKVTNFDDAGLQNFGRQIRDVARSDIPMAVNQLAALAAAAAQSGVPESDLLDFTRMAARAAVAWGVTGESAGESLAKIRTALRLTNEQTGLYADAINRLSDSAAATAPDLVDFSRRVASQGEFFGFSATQTLAFGTAMVAAGAESEVAATAFRNMGRALTRGASATRAQREAYRRLGLDSTRVARAMQRDAVGTTLDVIERLGRMPREMQASLMSDLFGDEARALAPLLTDTTRLREALALVARETNYAGAVTAEFERRARTTQYAWERFKAQITDVAISIGNILLPALNDMMRAVGPIAKAASDFAQANPVLVRTVIALAAGLVALRVAMIGVGFAGLMMKGGLLTLSAGLLSLARGATIVGGLLLAPFRLFRLALLAAGRQIVSFAIAARLGGVGTAFSSVLASMGTALLGLLNPMNVVRAAMIALRAAVITTGIGAVLVGIALAGMWIYNNWNGLVAMFQGIGEAIYEAMGPNGRAVIEAICSVLSTVWNWVTRITGTVDMSAEEWRALGRTIGESIVGAFTWVTQKAQEFLDFFLQMPSRIAGAFGQIVSSITGAGRNTAAEEAAVAAATPVPSTGGLPTPTPQSGGLIGRIAERNRAAAAAAAAAAQGAAPAAAPRGTSPIPAIPGAPATRTVPMPPAAPRADGPAPGPGAAAAPRPPGAGSPPAILAARRPEVPPAPANGALIALLAAQNAPRQEAPQRPVAGPVTNNVAPVFNISVTGIQNAQELAEQAARMVDSRLRATVRGLQADAGMATP